MALLPPFALPIMFFAVNSLALEAFTQVPGFPDVSYKDFIAPVAIFTAIFFSAGNAGIELVQDITGGYFKKLIIMPINKLTIILAKLTEIAVQALGQGIIMMVILAIAGVTIKSGFFGTLLIFAMLIVFAMAWSCISMIAALRTQNARLVQSLFIFVFPLLYLTTSQAPKDLLPSTFATLTTYNPVSYIIEGVRTLILQPGFSDPTIAHGFYAAGGMFIVLITLVMISFKKILK